MELATATQIFPIWSRRRQRCCNQSTGHLDLPRKTLCWRRKSFSTTEFGNVHWHRFWDDQQFLLESQVDLEGSRSHSQPSNHPSIFAVCHCELGWNTRAGCDHQCVGAVDSISASQSRRYRSRMRNQFHFDGSLDIPPCSHRRDRSRSGATRTSARRSTSAYQRPIAWSLHIFARLRCVEHLAQWR